MRARGRIGNLSRAQRAGPFAWVGAFGGLLLLFHPAAADELEFTMLPAGSALRADVELCTGEIDDAIISTIYAIDLKDAQGADTPILYFIMQQRWDDVWGSGPFRCDQAFEIVDRDAEGCAIIRCADDVTGRAALIRHDENGEYHYE